MRCDQEKLSISGGGIADSDGIYDAVTLHTYNIKSELLEIRASQVHHREKTSLGVGGLCLFYI